MATRSVTSLAAYLAALPPGRRAVVSAVRDVIVRNLPPGHVEGMSFGMIGYCVPLSRYPTTYNGQPLMLAAVAARKDYVSIYLMSVYGDAALEAWFRGAFAKAGKKLDLGKSCVRLRRLEDVPLDVIGEAVSRVSVDEHIARYERARSSARSRSRASASGANGKKVRAGR